MQALTFALARWAALGARSRALLGALLIGALLFAVVVGVLVRPVQTALFATALHPEQLEEVEERLAGWNVAFTPSQDNVLVEARQRNGLLLRLSLAGVPHAHLTGEDEALANVGALTPQSVIDAQALDGRADDIAASLRDVAGVQDARVIIAPAKSGEFAGENGSAATASVRLRLVPGVRLSAQSVAGIRDFVAAAVPGLSTAHVTILDDRGLALDTIGSASDDGGLESGLQSAFDAAFGAGATIVRVHDVGVISGGAHRLATAVFVDTSHAGDLLAIRDLAAATVGFDAQRGDTLAVQAVDFAHLPAVHRDAWWLLYGGIVPLLPTLACVTGALLALRLVIPALSNALRYLLERARIAEVASVAPEMAPARVRTLLAAEPPHAAAAVISALPAATAAAVLELYPPSEREAIVRRMHRRPSPLFADASEILRDG